MADEPQTTTTETEPTPAPPALDSDRGAAEVNAENRETAEAAAAQLLADLQAPTEQDRPRDEHGRFLPTKAEAEAAKSAPPSEPSKPAPGSDRGIDPVWIEAAKDAGLSEPEIALLRSDDDAQNAITTRRLSGQLNAMRTLGITPEMLTSYQQWQNQQAQQQQQGQPPTQPQAAPVSTVPEFKLELDENELTPEVVKPIKAMAEHLNKVTALLAAGKQEKEQLRQQLAELGGYVRQSAEQAQTAQREARTAHEWDQAAASVPGFVEYFGKPSELKRLQAQNPNDSKVVDAAAFAGYFGQTWGRYSAILGETPRALQLALRDAWQASPFSRLNGANGRAVNNNNSPLQPGSVVRSSPRRASNIESSVDHYQAEYERALEVVGAAYDENGGVSPFLARTS